MQLAAIINKQLFRPINGGLECADKADWLGLYFQSQNINLKANSIINITMRMESVASYD